MKLLYLFIAFILSRSVYGGYYYFLTKRYLKKYREYLNNPKDWYVEENKQKVVYVVKKANIEDSYLPSVEPVGFGYVQTGNFSLFLNLASRRKDVVQLVYSKLREANAVFRSRIFESFNPFYWIEVFVYFPGKVAQYFGIAGGRVVIKIFQVIWWFIIFLSTLVGIFFNENFISWLKKF